LSVNRTPPGSGPVLVIAGAGDPVAVTVKLPGVPMVNVAAVPLVNAGATGAGRTVSVKVCETGPPTPLVAVNVSV
jgi:hypothetical protein